MTPARKVAIVDLCIRWLIRAAILFLAIEVFTFARFLVKHH